MTKHGRMLKRWRRENDLDQYEAARRLRISQASVSRIESGDQAPGKAPDGKLAARIERVCAP